MYVIGISSDNLLNIQYVMDYVTGEMQIGLVISNVDLYAIENGIEQGLQTGFPGITAPTIFPTLTLAKKALTKIKELGSDNIKCDSIVRFLLEGNSLSVDDLRILKLGVIPDWQYD